MKNIAVIAVLALCLGLAGCKGEPTHTVGWYKAHDQERAAKLAECKANPGEKAAMPNCINAGKANDEKLSSRRGFSPLAPMKW
jgi:hypothetical protein